jgi:hypothetical protein
MRNPMPNSDTTTRSKLVRLAYDNPEMRADLLPLLKKASPPRATKRPPGQKFRESINNWIKGDIQTRMENAGVPQKTISQYVGSFEGVLLDQEFRTKKFTYFETQQEVVDWIAGKFKPPFITEKYLIDYNKYVDDAAARYGQADNRAIRDKALSAWNKLKPGQQYLAGFLIFGRYHSEKDIRGKIKNFADAYIENQSKKFIESVLPAIEWASKAPEPPRLNVAW